MNNASDRLGRPKCSILITFSDFKTKRGGLHFDFARQHIDIVHLPFGTVVWPGATRLTLFLLVSNITTITTSIPELEWYLADKEPF